MIDLFNADWRTVWDGRQDADPVGAVFTRPEIVSLILDLAGYDPIGRDLVCTRVLEPSCGDGAFTREIVSRVVRSIHHHYGRVIDWRVTQLADCMRACDISAKSVAIARKATTEVLVSAGCPPRTASRLASTWIIHTDFLLHGWEARFDFVVGNPPYVRIEELPAAVLSAYRARFETTSDRADVYVAFIQRGLELLSETGVLAFICANRFTKNLYGTRLRKMITSGYHVRYYLNLEHTQPFEIDVSAYPGVFVIDRARGEATRSATLRNLDEKSVRRLRLPRNWSRFESWYSSGEPWVSTDVKEHKRLATLGSTLPVLEDSAPGTKVGIGVATGADEAFVLDKSVSGVEEDATLPLVMAADIGNDKIRWSGHRLLNPFDRADDGRLLDLNRFDGVARHLARFEETLRKRHVARRGGDRWFRTIDRVWPTLLTKPKLVIPDIQSKIVVGYDRGEYYPHHNVYWITSDTWDLLALKALLRSAQVVSQIRAFSVQMRGGAIRFQAQTLRKVRVPRFCDLPPHVVAQLRDAALGLDQAAVDTAGDAAFAAVLGREKQRPRRRPTGREVVG